MTNKFPDGCIRCHFRPANRISRLCDDCEDIKQGVRKHREKIVQCTIPGCNKMFADFHGVTAHIRDKYGPHAESR